MTSTPSAMPNRLANERSPYLLQHAHNPVDWYPWGEEAFEAARRSDRPLFVSIGYSTCHWCHVMERESFEDRDMAAMMNEFFVNIKVDREERPDVDEVYMAAAQAVTGSGGWPLSVWLTHELQPFYVGTYFPPHPMPGRPSFGNVLESLHHAWLNDRDKVNRSAEAITRAITEGMVVVEESLPEGEGAEVIDACYRQIARSYDPSHGGFGGAPKFPRPVLLDFLLRYHAARTSDEALTMATDTLKHMSAGGMYDQLGGGFARYSVDAEWRVPHFEKMLYDQGQLLATLADAWRLTRDGEFARVIRQTVGYLERDMLAPEGAFFSAEDADSEGVEGAFYVWTQAELAELLTASEYQVVVQRYGVTKEGNFEHGRNVLHTSAELRAIAAKAQASEDEIAALLESAHAKLFHARLLRERPSRDEKILASWNGLAITGLARAGAALGEPRYVRLATGAADFVLSRMIVDGRLLHRYRDGDVKYPGYLDDYAFVARGLIDLYEAGFEVRFLREAERLVREAIRLFLDDEGGGFFNTSGEDPSVLVRSKSDHDGAEPSGNSVISDALLRLGRLFYDSELVALAERTIRLFVARVAPYPMSMPLMIAAELSREGPPSQLVIAASRDEAATRSLVRQAQQRYRPDTALVFVPADGSADPWLLEKIPTAEAMGPVDGAPAAYVCENFVCQAPVLTLD